MAEPEENAAEDAPPIRAARPDDIPQILELIEPYVAVRQLLPRTEEELAVLVRHGFIAERKGRVVGFAAVEIYSRKLAELQCLKGELQGEAGLDVEVYCAATLSEWIDALNTEVPQYAIEPLLLPQ